MILYWIVIILFILYSSLIVYYWLSWNVIPVFEPGITAPRTAISVIIPARNEEEHIGALLEALREQDYPASLIQVIVIDDHSTDRTANIVKQFNNVLLVSLRENDINSYKKKAIEKGIEAAIGQLIVTTDADCIPPRQWLSLLAAFKEENRSAFIAAPVVMDCNNTVLQSFQAMDFMILQGITGAAVYKKQLAMCNGANLAYEKNVFDEVNGFTGVDHIASGDDMLLMQKIKTRYPEQVHYLRSKNAIVSTQPMKTWRTFFNQRIRWASKAGNYTDKKIFLVLLLVYLFNCSFLALAIAGFYHYQYWIGLLGLWVFKTIVEFPFFISVARFFNKQWAIKLFFFFQPLHILYTIISGLFGQFGKYEWKGRRIK